MLSINNLTYGIAGRILVEDASVNIPNGRKVGLVGRNGCGKSTLFRVILGELASQEGSVELSRGATIGQVAQEAPATEQSLVEIVLAADQEREMLLAQAQTETDPNKIAEVQTRLVDIDAHSAPARAARILAGLGFDEAAQQRPASSFSGGWRMRVALAAVLFTEPDLLLLDEPTNYLDLEGTLWLQNYLARYPHTVLLISHDRDLLNTSVNSILHLENQSLTFYTGNYDTFSRMRAEKMAQQAKQAEKQAAHRAHLEKFVERFRAKATKAKQAQSRLKMLEKMQPISVISEEASAQLDFPSPQRQLSSPIIAMQSVQTGYEAQNPILGRLNLRIDSDDRIALLGANGNGKSTFAKLLCERLELFSGEMKRAEKMKVGMFAQHQLDDLRPQETPVDHIRTLMPDEGEAKIRARVAQIGLSREKMDTKAADLSGGEKARLMLGMITHEAPDLLILDEPTNHLDIDTRAALVTALNNFSGAVILISHDRHLIEASVDRLWVVKNGTVQAFEGDMNDYRRELLSGELSGGKDQEAKAEGAEDKVSNADKRKQAAELRQKLAPLKKQITALERQMDDARAKIEKLDIALAAPDLFNKDAAKGAELSKQRADMVKALDDAEELWLEKSEEYESAVAG